MTTVHGEWVDMEMRVCSWEMEDMDRTLAVMIHTRKEECIPMRIWIPWERVSFVCGLDILTGMTGMDVAVFRHWLFEHDSKPAKS